MGDWSGNNPGGWGEELKQDNAKPKTASNDDWGNSSSNANDNNAGWGSGDTGSGWGGGGGGGGSRGDRGGGGRGWRGGRGSSDSRGRGRGRGGGGDSGGGWGGGDNSWGGGGGDNNASSGGGGGWGGGGDKSESGGGGWGGGCSDAGDRGSSGRGWGRGFSDSPGGGRGGRGGRGGFRGGRGGRGGGGYQSSGGGWGSNSNNESTGGSGGWGNDSSSNTNASASKSDGWGSSSDNKSDWGGGGRGGGGRGGGGGSSGWGGGGDSGATNSGWGSGGGGGGSDKGNSWGGGGGAKRGRDDDNNQSDWGSSSKNNAVGGDSWGGCGGTDSTGVWRSNQDKNAADSPNKRIKTEDDEERPPPFKPSELDLDEEAKLQAEGAGENFQKYHDQKVNCIPKDAILPVDKFEDVITSKLLLDNVGLQKFSQMSAIQKWAIPAILEGNDLIGCAQTGSGKTAAFLLPVLQTLLNMKLEPSNPNSDIQNPYCLIISPTRELASQINTHALLLSRDSIIKCLVIYGQISTAHLKSKLSLGCHILVATPGRLKDFVERGWIGFKNIKYVILDEGDRLVDEGFSTEIRNFFNHPTMPPREDRQTLFFSATFKEATQVQAREYLRENFIFLTVGRIGAANEDIKQEFIQVSRSEKKRELKKMLATLPEDAKTIVFTQTKVTADVLAGFFNACNLSSTSIHGDRHQSQREQAISAFRRGEKRFLISSPVGNRGLDLPKVALVINYDLPKSIDEYVHRIGRTGRAGHTGRAISFYEPDYDRELLPELLVILKEAKQEIPSFLSGEAEFGAIESGPAGSEDWSVSNNNTTAVGDDDWGNTASDPQAASDPSTPADQSTKAPKEVKPQEKTQSSETKNDDWLKGVDEW